VVVDDVEALLLLEEEENMLPNFLVTTHSCASESSNKPDIMAESLTTDIAFSNKTKATDVFQPSLVNTTVDMVTSTGAYTTPKTGSVSLDLSHTKARGDSRGKKLTICAANILAPKKNTIK